MKILSLLIHPYFLISLGVILAAWFFSYFRNYRRLAILKKSLNFRLYEISLPRAQKEPNKPLKDLISGMEQFYTGMTGVKPYFALEIASPSTENETNFYAAVPGEYASFLEKQVHSIFPSAEIREEKSDYNIFKYKGAHVGAAVLLQQNPVLPIKSYESFTADPLEVLANVFAKMSREEEGAALQIIVDPNKNSFKDRVEKTLNSAHRGDPLKSALSGEGKTFLSSLLKVITGGSLYGDKSKEETLSGFSAEQNRNNTLELLNKKNSKQIMKANIRLVVSARTKERTRHILNEIKSVFSQFSNPQANSFFVKELRGLALKKLFYDFSFRFLNEWRTVYLNTEELTSVFHFPSAELSAPRVKFLTAKKAEPPSNLPTDGLLIGKNIFRDTETQARIANDDRRRHFYSVGQTGTGKSVLMKNMALQDIQEGKGTCFIDPHGDSVEELLGQIPEKRWGDVIYFNPADTKSPFGLNMLEYDQKYPEQKTFIVNELLEIFNKLYDMSVSGGPMFEQYFRNATLLVMEDPLSGSTLLEISRVLSDADFRQYKLSKSKNLVVNNFWKETAEKAGGEAALQNMVPYITSKFDTFLANEIMRPILCQEKSSFNFREIMDEGKILLINLSKGRLGETNAHLLGMILVGKLFMAAMSRVDIQEDLRKDFSLYIDEFQNVTTKSIAMILSEARKYHLNLIITHQFIGQLEEEVKKAVFGNIGSLAVFRVGNEDAEFLTKYFEPVFSQEDLINIPNYSAYLKLLIRGETSRPFNIQTSPPKKSSEETREGVKNNSSLKYGRPQSEIELEISKRYAKAFRPAES